MLRKKIWANVFSTYRLIAAPVLLVIALLGYRQLFAWLLLFSYATDMIDGYLARTLKTESKLGSRLDSIADQLTFVVAMSGLVIFEWDFVLDQIYIIGVVVFFYLLQMVLAFQKYGKITSFHTYLAKTSALCQGVFIVWLLMVEPVLWLFYLTAALGLIETLEEIVLIFMHREWTTDVKGIYWVLRKRKIERERERV